MASRREHNDLRTYETKNDIPYYGPVRTFTEVSVDGKKLNRETIISIDNLHLNFRCYPSMLKQLSKRLHELSCDTPVTTDAKRSYTITYKIVQGNGVYTIGLGYINKDGILDEAMCSVICNPNKCFTKSAKNLELLMELREYAVDGVNLQKFDVAFDVAFERKLTHFGFQGTTRRPYNIHDTEYVGEREYHKNDMYTKIYEKAPHIVRIEITVWNKDSKGRMTKRCLKPTSIALKIIQRLPVIYFSDISDLKDMKKEKHIGDKFYLSFRSIIETCRANQNPFEILRTEYVDKFDKKTINRRRKGKKIPVEVENTFEYDYRKRKQIIVILESYGLTQFRIIDTSKLIETLSFYQELMVQLNTQQEFEDDIEW